MVRALLLAALALGAGCARTAAPNPCEDLQRWHRELPPLKPIPKSEMIRLNVTYLEDERLPNLTAQGRAKLYQRVSQLAREWYGYDVRFDEVGQRSLLEEMKAPVTHAPPGTDACIALRHLDPETEPGLRSVVQRIGDEYDKRGPEVFARQFPSAAGKPRKEAVMEAAGQFMARYRGLSGISTEAGPLLASEAAKRAYAFTRWAAYLEFETDVDFVITNGALIEADDDMPIYVLARGGLTTGFVDNAPDRRYGAAGMVSLMPFLNGEALFKKGAPPTPPDVMLDAAATMWMHELGHFLLRYGEMYGESGCVHVASEGVDYFGWHRAIRTAGNKCSKLPDVLTKY